MKKQNKNVSARKGCGWAMSDLPAEADIINYQPISAALIRD